MVAPIERGSRHARDQPRFTAGALMRPRDWLILAVLLGAAAWTGWGQLADTPIGHFLAGTCEPVAGGGRRFHCVDRPAP
jgi:hypothetical protein